MAKFNTLIIKQKRTVAFLLAVLLMAGVLFGSGGPLAIVSTHEAQVHRYLSPYDSDANALAIQNELYYGVLERREYIDISATPVTVAECSKIWNDLRREAPDLYMVNNAYSYSYKTINGIRYVTKFWPKYNMTAEEMANAQLVWYNEISEILSTRNPDWNAMQTIMYFHDYLILKCQYDNSYTYYDAYNMLTKDTGVCMAYTLLYQALLEAVGLSCDYVSSQEMNHIWNRVRLGSSIFNVDVTWDDPTPDRLGRVDHYHLLTSDSVMDDNHQYTWEEGYGLCTDDIYDDAFWRDVHTAIIPVGDEFFFIYKGSFYKWTTDNKLVKCVSLSSKWYTDAKKRSYWYQNNTDGSKNYNFSVIWPAGDKILYNSTSSIKTFDPKTNKLATVYTHKGYGNICGFSYDGSTLTMQVGYNPFNMNECETIVIPNFVVS